MTTTTSSPTSRRDVLCRSALLAGAMPLALKARLYGADAPGSRVRIGAMGASRNRIGGGVDHLANIAYRTGHTIDYDGKPRRIVDDPEARQLWGRRYEDGWMPVF